MPRNSGKGEFETRWLCRHVIAQQATAAKRQMRCNQIPRKMLQKLQEDHHRRRLEAERSGPIQGGVTGGTNPPDPAQPNAAAQAPQSATAAGGGYSPATNAGRNPAEGLAPQRGGTGRAQVPPWASDLRVIKGTPQPHPNLSPSLKLLPGKLKSVSDALQRTRRGTASSRRFHRSRRSCGRAASRARPCTTPCSSRTRWSSAR